MVKPLARLFIAAAMLMSTQQLCAQTEIDGIMMSKKNLCIGPMYSYSSWKDYWEGTRRRNNENLGTVSTQMFAIMGNYGITDKLNVLFGLPYVKTKASAGTLHGLKGIQDFSLWLKYMPLEKKFGKAEFSAYVIGGISTPASNYAADFLPMSIGLRSTNLMLRGMLDFQMGDIFATGSAMYVWRSNIKIDRSAYYTTEMHLTNEVEMPNAASFNFRAGYRSDWLVAEAVVNNWTTLGGFDITRNNMPFPSNRMNMTSVGVNLKYVIKAVDGLSLTGGSNYVVKGRNVGQSTAFNGGIFYIIDFSPKQKSTPASPKKN